MLTASHIYVRVQRCGSPATRCIGGQFSLCSPEFDGPYCSQCASNHYSQGFLCLPCIEGSAQKRTIIIVSFIIIFNSVLLFANYEVSVTLLGVSLTALHWRRCSLVHLPLLTPAPDLQYVCMRQVVSTLQCFRGIGMYVSTVHLFLPRPNAAVGHESKIDCFLRGTRGAAMHRASFTTRVCRMHHDRAAGWVPLGYRTRYRCCYSITLMRVSVDDSRVTADWISSARSSARSNL